jgi:hypothetical protein
VRAPHHHPLDHKCRPIEPSPPSHHPHRRPWPKSSAPPPQRPASELAERSSTPETWRAPLPAWRCVGDRGDGSRARGVLVVLPGQLRILGSGAGDRVSRVIRLPDRKEPHGHLQDRKGF